MMWLRLVRDRGSLVLVFVLPGLIFTIFAAIFSNSAGGDLDLRVAMAAETNMSISDDFSSYIETNAPFSLSYDRTWNIEAVKTRVRLGQDDVGFFIAPSNETPTGLDIIIIKDPGREVAASVLMGQLRQLIVDWSGQDAQDIFKQISAIDQPENTGPADATVTYYVGATAILFLLFSAMQAATLSLDERKLGITRRLLLSPMAQIKNILGKFSFILFIGIIQSLVILAIAQLYYAVDITQNFLGLALACLGSTSLAAALALCVVELCRTHEQMNTISTFLVLLFSAIGGSMVPSFMMPTWLQALGPYTPNYWAIEAYYGILARDQSSSDLILIWSVLLGMTIVLLCATFIITRVKDPS